MAAIRSRTGRREFLLALGAAGAAPALEAAAQSGRSSTKALRGVFPIGQTPFDPAGKLDLDGLASEVRFCRRGGVHGFVWPQIASGWSVLTEKERLEGAEAILSAAKGGNTAIVIGVQSPDMGSVERYARHAEKFGADALISLPPPGVTDPNALLDFYRQISRFSELPLFMQTQGSMSTDLVVQAFESIPTLRYVKDEAGDPLARVSELRRRTDGRLHVFSGNGVRTMITEMELGFAGHCPFTGLADLYAAAYELFHSGRPREAWDMFGRILVYNSMASESGNSLLIARGVFKEGTTSREAPPAPDAAGRGAAGRGATSRAGRKSTPDEIREVLERYLKPYLRA
jgi:4-hydroxy-tetrahydrodipicolinate synthase